MRAIYLLCILSITGIYCLDEIRKVSGLFPLPPLYEKIETAINLNCFVENNNRLSISRASDLLNEFSGKLFQRLNTEYENEIIGAITRLQVNEDQMIVLDSLRANLRRITTDPILEINYLLPTLENAIGYDVIADVREVFRGNRNSIAILYEEAVLKILRETISIRGNCPVDFDQLRSAINLQYTAIVTDLSIVENSLGSLVNNVYIDAYTLRRTNQLTNSVLITKLRDLLTSINSAMDVLIPGINVAVNNIKSLLNVMVNDVSNPKVFINITLTYFLQWGRAFGHDDVAAFNQYYVDNSIGTLFSSAWVNSTTVNLTSIIVDPRLSREATLRAFLLAVTQLTNSLDDLKVDEVVADVPGSGREVLKMLFETLRSSIALQKGRGSSGASIMKNLLIWISELSGNFWDLLQTRNYYSMSTFQYTLNRKLLLNNIITVEDVESANAALSLELKNAYTLVYAYLSRALLGIANVGISDFYNLPMTNSNAKFCEVPNDVGLFQRNIYAIICDILEKKAGFPIKL